MLRTFMSRGRRIALALCTITAAGCAHLGMGAGSSNDAYIVFHNQSTDQADVFAVAPGTDLVRIGTVFPGGADTLRIRSSLLTSGAGVNIVARLLARSNTPSSGAIPLRAGDLFEVRLASDGRSISVQSVAR